MNFSRQFKLKRDQILVLIAKDFNLKYNSTALGFLWSLLVPTLTSVVVFLLGRMVFRKMEPGFAEMM